MYGYSAGGIRHPGDVCAIQLKLSRRIIRKTLLLRSKRLRRMRRVTLVRFWKSRT